MPNTPINGLPSPTDSSPNDPPIHFDALNAVLDSRLIARFATTTARDSAITTPVNGMTVWCDSPGAYYDRVAGQWLQRQVAWTQFAPTWTAASAPSIGNGSLTGWQVRNGKTCHFQIELKFGSTTNGGAGSWAFGSLPYSAATTREQIVLVKGYTNGDLNFAGFGLLNNTTVVPYLPIGTANGSMLPVRNADASSAVGTGIPQISGTYAFSGTATTPPRNLSIYGSYEIA